MDSFLNESSWESIEQVKIEKANSEVTVHSNHSLSLSSAIGSCISGLAFCFTVTCVAIIETILVPFLLFYVQFSWSAVLYSYGVFHFISLLVVYIVTFLSVRFSDYVLIIVGLLLGAIGSFEVGVSGTKSTIGGICVFTVGAIIANSFLVPRYSMILGPGPQKLRILVLNFLVMLGRFVGPFFAVSVVNPSDIKSVFTFFQILTILFGVFCGMFIVFFKCVSLQSNLDTTSMPAREVKRDYQTQEHSRTPVIILPHSYPGVLIDREFSYKWSRFSKIIDSEHSVNSNATG